MFAMSQERNMLLLDVRKEASNVHPAEELFNFHVRVCSRCDHFLVALD